jgi:alpha-ketoglutarate-dependent taurine dioxygenase
MTFTLQPVVPLKKQTGVDFGAIVEDLDLETITRRCFFHLSRKRNKTNNLYIIEEDFDKLFEAVYTHQVVVVRNQGHVQPKTQYELTKRFDPQNIDIYGHGSMHKAAESVISRDISPLPDVPQVQLLGHGIVRNHYGIDEKKLTHPSHTVFHKTPLTKEEMDAGYTRFYRWHMDAALYKLNPPKVTTLFSIKNPESRHEIVRYDDGTGDELDVQLGTTACKYFIIRGYFD